MTPARSSPLHDRTLALKLGRLVKAAPQVIAIRLLRHGRTSGSTCEHPEHVMELGENDLGDIVFGLLDGSTHHPRCRYSAHIYELGKRGSHPWHWLWRRPLASRADRTGRRTGLLVSGIRPGPRHPRGAAFGDSRPPVWTDRRQTWSHCSDSFPTTASTIPETVEELAGHHPHHHRAHHAPGPKPGPTRVLGPFAPQPPQKSWSRGPPRDRSSMILSL